MAVLKEYRYDWKEYLSVGMFISGIIEFCFYFVIMLFFMGVLPQ